ncbi:MAG: 8-oxoguanine DNA glycosylase [Blastocatellia bacterium]|nr:8-oxoguanine DNA glycosylase [Blastocatellia bacterium]MCS7157093.1 8-oxoguanine DNA glycosylase [Blastocatellia bacterium]MCX7752294.1 8-oxoguanine DNA glycosylase [Blastocatellia bacterium]MDW8167786.1 DNA glycosylase [Acidobacteriota bacterium]MDW8256607.1 DNA glycosylase [Acidobacteriota bacterium]
MPEIVIPVGEFDLEQTLESGQCFRWKRVRAGEYIGVIGRSALHIQQVPRRLLSDPLASAARGDARSNVLLVRFIGGRVPQEAERAIVQYFDLSRDYPAILRQLRHDAALASVVPRRAGIHILRQEPFETIISFIISANNHIPRIRLILERLCARYGEEIRTPWGPMYSFPRPDVLAEARLADLREHCGLGYRDRYVLATARAIAECADFASWSTWPTLVLRRRLLALEGVGEKVADCILLFGFHRLEAFPVDTWIARAMQALYFPDRIPRLREIRACAVERFGSYAGVAQQYLYAAFRAGKKVARPSREPIEEAW